VIILPYLPFNQKGPGIVTRIPGFFFNDSKIESPLLQWQGIGHGLMEGRRAKEKGAGRPLLTNHLNLKRNFTVSPVSEM
jgi:hypothetical protein